MKVYILSLALLGLLFSQGANGDLCDGDVASAACKLVEMVKQKSIHRADMLAERFGEIELSQAKGKKDMTDLVNKEVQFILKKYKSDLQLATKNMGDKLKELEVEVDDKLNKTNIGALRATVSRLAGNIEKVKGDLTQKLHENAEDYKKNLKDLDHKINGELKDVSDHFEKHFSDIQIHVNNSFSGLSTKINGLAAGGEALAKKVDQNAAGFNEGLSSLSKKLEKSEKDAKTNRELDRKWVLTLVDQTSMILKKEVQSTVAKMGENLKKEMEAKMNSSYAKLENEVNSKVSKLQGDVKKTVQSEVERITADLTKVKQTVTNLAISIAGMKKVWPDGSYCILAWRVRGCPSGLTLVRTRWSYLCCKS